MINLNIRQLILYISFLALLPMIGHANGTCPHSVTTEEIDHIVFANLNVWDGTIRLLDWITEKHPVSDSSTPIFSSSIPDAIRMQKGKTGKPIILGNAFQVYTLLPDKIRNYRGGTGFLSLTVPTGTWFVPAFIEGKAVSIIEISCIKDQPKIIGVGAKLLAEALVSFQNSSMKLNLSKEQRFVRIYQSMSDFVATEQDIGEVVYPLTFIEEYLTIQPVDEKGGYTPINIMTVLNSKLSTEIH